MDTYERQLEQMRQALAKAWAEGYHMARLDERYEPRGHFSPNPYVKEN